MRTSLILAALGGLGFASAAHAEDPLSRLLLDARFGFAPVANSTASIDAATADADPTKLITLGRGLQVRVVTAAPDAPPNIDQMVLWPNDRHPTHLIAMNEEDTGAPGMVRIRLSDGHVDTILSGTTDGDPIRLTPWGTILAGEEAGNTGQVIEIANPLSTTNVLYDRATGTATNGSSGTGAENVALRRALGHLSFEGLALLPSGVVYYSDELRPTAGAPGGSFYKFIPTTLYTGQTIRNLSDSPFASGQVYGLQLSRGNNVGQGNNTGLGVWVPVANANDADLRVASAALHLAGFYRPEDLELDRIALAAGKVKMCGNDTGNETDNNYGETICLSDGTPAQAASNAANPELQFFMIGNPELAMPDNISHDVVHGLWAINEDGEGPTVGKNNDIWACLEDGPDFDLLTDGCARFASLNDLTAESTGGLFDAEGRHYYVSIQHNVTGHGVVLDITGWGRR